MTTRLEHANLCVRDIDGVIRFLQTAFPEFRVRFDGVGVDGVRWVHVGTDETYLALNPSAEHAELHRTLYGDQPGVNHLAYVVDDADAVRRRLIAAGYKDSTPPNSHPARKRVYFYDAEGNDWEFVEYLTDDPALRHDYTQPDH